MNSETAHRWRGTIRLVNVLVSIAFCALLAACVSQRTAPAPAAAASAITRSDIVGAVLKALDFQQRDDGYHLSLPAPLLFPFDSDVIAPGAHDTLTRVGRELKELGIERALVRGHTDSVGTNEYNLALSKRRADAVAKVLVDGGYPADKIDAKGLAASVPVTDNGSAEGRAKNRRVVIIVQSM